MESSIFLTDNQIAQRYGVSRITVWRWNKELPGFPKVIKLSEGCARWALHEVEEFEKSCAMQRAS
jgi:prophage regulatory protein